MVEKEGNNLDKKERRKILFRGKYKANNIWVYGDLLNDGFIIAKDTNIWQLPNGAYKIDEYVVPVKDETIGQFTGLYDINGNMIFEGDIARLEIWGVKSERQGEPLVRHKFGEENLLIEYKTIRGSDGDGNNIVYDGFCAGENSVRELIEAENWNFEIIGNIHDNPELLEAHNG